MKTKNSLFVNVVALACCFLLFNFKSYSQTYRYDGEIMGEVIGVEEGINWRVNAQCVSSYRWEIDETNGECYLTNDHETAYIEGEGNNPTDKGFKAPCGHKGHEYDIAFAYYQFTFDLPGSKNDITFTLDLHDADWTGNYSSPYDITIRWDISNRELKYRIGAAGNPYYYLDKNTIWDILDESPPNQQPFQLPPPGDFMCLNPTTYGAHPEFYWREIIGSPEFCILYKIYRAINHGNFDCVASSLEIISWTDVEVTLGASGDRFTYYITAYTENSPESSPSRWVYIFGGISKQFAITDSNKYLFSKGKNTNSINMTIYPNPCNPTAKISYFCTRTGVSSNINI